MAAKKKTVTRKKARTPAQKAATRRLVAANKKRAVTRKKSTTRKKTAMRKRNPSGPVLYYIGVSYPKGKIRWYDGEGLTPNKPQAVLFKDMLRAEKIATKIANRVNKPVKLYSSRPVKKK